MSKRRAILEMVKNHQITTAEAYEQLNKLRRGEADSHSSTVLSYQSQWDEAPLVHQRDLSRLSGDLLVYEARGNFTPGFTQFWAAQTAPHQAVFVKPGPHYEDLGGGVFQLNPGQLDDFRRLRGDLQKRQISPVYLLYFGPDAPVNGLAPQGEGDILCVYLLLRAFGESKARSLKQFLVVHAAGDRPPAGGANPWMSALAGFSKSLEPVWPNLVFRTMGIPAGISADRLQLVLGELTVPKPGELPDEVCYQGGKRLIKKYSPLELAPAGPIPLKKQGVYLITGGAGELGKLFARYLAEKYQAKIALIGRTPLNQKQQSFLEELRKNHPDIMYLRADVADLQAMTGAVGQIKARFGEINGIIHAAGTRNTKTMFQKSPEEFQEVLRPKIQGTIILDAVTQAEPLDFFLIFSSTASLMGDFGLGDYAVANRFADSFGVFRESRRAHKECRGRTIIINWPLWKEGSMHLPGESEALYLKTSGMDYLESETGIAVFEKILAGGYPQVVVIVGDKKRFHRYFGVESAPGESQRPAPIQPSSRNHPGKEDRLAEAALLSPELPLERRLELALQKMASKLLKVDPGQLDLQGNLGDFGFDSYTLKEFSVELNDTFTIDISPAAFFAHNTLQNLAGHLLEEYREEIEGCYRKTVPSSSPPVASAPVSVPEIPSAGVLQRLPPLRERFAQLRFGDLGAAGTAGRGLAREPVAIIGISGKFPGSKDLFEFWDHLEAGRDLITEVPPERWDWRQYYSEQKTDKQKTVSKWGGFIQDIDKFDPQFFNISPREAELMDPQHRLFLENAWRAIEDAGYKASQFSGRNIGVFVGVQFNDYQQLLMDSSPEIHAQMGTGNVHALIGNRVSYLLNFRGPSESIDTACSSSSVAVHRAVKSIQNGESELAIAGGVSLMVSGQTFLTAGVLGVLSPDGRCKTFDKRANGYVKGEGVGAIFLKPLRKAVEDRDHIYAVIKATAENHGGKANSLTAPNSEAQAALLVRAYEEAGIGGESVTYIETHGTGTELGDPVEVEGLKKAFSEMAKRAQKPNQRKYYCGLGALKTNIGHLEPASGIAGIIKVILALTHQKIPGILHFQELNPYINLKDTPFYIVNQTKYWEPLTDDQGNPIPRRAGVSSFGFGGANAHIVLEEYECSESKAVISADLPYLIVLSAKDEERLQAYAAEIASFLEKKPGQKERIAPARFPELVPDLLKLVAEVAEVAEKDLGVGDDLSECGFDPVKFTQLAGLIQYKYQIDLAGEAVANLGSLHSLGAYLGETYPEQLAGYYSVSPRERKDLPDSLSLERIAYTLQVGREAMEERLALVATSIRNLEEKLARFSRGEGGIPDLFRGNQKSGSDSSQAPAIVAELKGQGVHYQGLIKLAELWVRGAEIHWESLYPAPPPQRIPLPGYPFARERYWPSKPDPAQTGALKTVGMAALHLLIDENVSTLEEQCYRKVLTDAEFFLRDHVIEGAMIFPGVAYLEMARMAGELARPKTKVTKLINTIWAKPVIVQRPVPVYISLYPDGDMIEFEVFTPGEPRAQEEQRVIHSRGKLISGYSEDSVARGQSPESVDLAVLKQSLNQVKSGRECYQLFQEIGFNYGTGFQAIRELYEGETQSMAALELPGVLSGGFGDFVLHPSLMDGALQAIVGILQNRETRAGTIHLPYAVGEIEILKPLTRICYACASLVSGGSSSTSGIKKFDIRICDQAGNVLIKIKDFSTRAFVYDAARKTPEAQIPEKQPPLAGKAWETQLSELLKKVEAGTLNAETADEMMEAINE